jgi:hypothetical protein
VGAWGAGIFANDTAADVRGDAELYEDGAPARLRALRGLADKLTGPQPKPKKLRGPRPGPHPGVEVGDVVRIWSSDRSRKRWPELLGLYREGGDLPSRDELERLPYMSNVDLGAVGPAGLPPSDLFGWAAPYEMTILVSRPARSCGPRPARSSPPACAEIRRSPKAGRRGPGRRSSPRSTTARSR